MNQDLAQPVGWTTTICSFACLGAQVVWVATCYLFAATPGPDAGTAEDVVKGWLAVLAAMAGAFVGVCLLSAPVDHRLRLQAWMDRGGLTQATAAARLGVTRSVIANVAAGLRRTSADLAARLAAAFREEGDGQTEDESDS